MLLNRADFLDYEDFSINFFAINYKELVQRQYDIVFGYLASLTKEGTP